MKKITSIVYLTLLCIANLNFAHASLEPLYRTVCIPELQYFSISNYSYPSAFTMYKFDTHNALKELWEKTGFIYVTDYTDVPFEDAESYNEFCPVGAGISFAIKRQCAPIKCYDKTEQNLKIAYKDQIIYEGEISEYGGPVYLHSLEYTGGKFTLESVMTAYPLMQSVSLNIEYFPELLNSIDGVLSEEHEAFKLPFTLEKFHEFIQPEEEMAIYEPQTTIRRFPEDATQDFVEFLHITCTPQIKHFSLRRINVDAKYVDQYDQEDLSEKLWSKHGVIYTTDSSSETFEDADQLEVSCYGGEDNPQLKLIVKRQLVPDDEKKCEYEIREYFQFLHDGDVVYEGIGTDDFCNNHTVIELLEFDGDRLKIHARKDKSYIEILDWPTLKSHYEYEESPLDFEKLSLRIKENASVNTN